MRSIYEEEAKQELENANVEDDIGIDDLLENLPESTNFTRDEDAR